MQYLYRKFKTSENQINLTVNMFQKSGAKKERHILTTIEFHN